MCSKLEKSNRNVVLLPPDNVLVGSKQYRLKDRAGNSTTKKDKDSNDSARKQRKPD